MKSIKPGLYADDEGNVRLVVTELLRAHGLPVTTEFRRFLTNLLAAEAKKQFPDARVRVTQPCA